MTGAEAGKHQYAEQVDQGHDGSVGHRRQGNPGAAVDARSQGGTDVVVEADTALKHRSEVGTLMVRRALIQHQQYGTGQGREHQCAGHAQHRYAIEVGSGQAMEEQRRQQDVVAQALGARPEALGKKPRRRRKVPSAISRMMGSRVVSSKCSMVSIPWSGTCTDYGGGSICKNVVFLSDR